MPAFSDVAAHVRMGINLETPDGLQNLLTDVVSDNYFAFMGVRPELGRLPSENELRYTDSPVIILGHAAWKSIFAGDPSPPAKLYRCYSWLSIWIEKVWIQTESCT